MLGKNDCKVALFAQLLLILTWCEVEGESVLFEKSISKNGKSASVRLQWEEVLKKSRSSEVKVYWRQVSILFSSIQNKTTMSL